MKNEGVTLHSEFAEQSVLGALLISETAFDQVCSYIELNDFYFPAHRKIFEVILGLNLKKTAVDIFTVADTLENREELEAAGGRDYIHNLAASVPYAIHVESYAKIVREKAIFRQILAMGQNIVDVMNHATNNNVDDFLDKLQASLFSLSEKYLMTGRQRMMPLFKVAEQALGRLEDLKKDQNGLTGLASGFIHLDKLTGGFQRSDLIVLAARPSMGKTSFALNIATHAMKTKNAKALIFSMEMDADQIALRMVSSMSEQSLTAIRAVDHRTLDWNEIGRAVRNLCDRRIYVIDDSVLTPLDIKTMARKFYKEQNGIDLIIIDYLQLMHVPNMKSNANRAEEVAVVSRSLKALAKELRVPVIALSQLNRSLESRQEKRPLMADLRDSGAIEQDADLILFIYRDEIYNKETEDKGLAEIIIGKNRNGPTGSIKTIFNGEWCTFLNYCPEEKFTKIIHD